MKLISYISEDFAQAAILVNNRVYDLDKLNSHLPNEMIEFLWEGADVMDKAKDMDLAIKSGDVDLAMGKPVGELALLAPLPQPTSCRDAYAFRQHVASARRNRGVDMIPEFDQFPIFYFTNHNAVEGPGEISCMPDHFVSLDFELEVAAIIGKPGRNVLAKDADAYIAGYTIMNDMSARGLQMEEMKLNLGPAKGKDFSTVIGPSMVTPDELEENKCPALEGHTGHNYNLEMTCKVNGKEVSRGNWNTMHWTFAEIIERCSYGADILPGDVIGSGTVGTGCFLELNGTAKRNDPNAEPQWLQPGDEIEMAIDGLGTLWNKVVEEESDHSILALKKMSVESGG